MEIVKKNVQSVAKTVVTLRDTDSALTDEDRTRDHLPIYVRIVFGMTHEKIDILDNHVRTALSHRTNGVGNGINQGNLGIRQLLLEETHGPIATHVGQRVFVAVKVHPIVHIDLICGQCGHRFGMQGHRVVNELRAGDGTGQRT